MVRVLAVVLWIAVTVYALADWYRTPEEETPAGIPKPVWLLVMIVTAPSFSIGAIAWLILRAVRRAEAGQSPLSMPSSSSRDASQQPNRPAPDDDPDFLFRLERDIQRERKRREASSESADDRAPTDGADAKDEGEPGETEEPGEDAAPQG